MRWQERQQRRRSYNDQRHAHELTFSCYQKFSFLKSERTCQWLAESIDQARRRHSFQLWAFVFMPDHAHLIVYPQFDDYKMSRIVSSIKAPIAKRAIEFLVARRSPWLERITRTRGARRERLFWQSGGGFDRNIVCGKTLLRMIDYIHNNPVRRGLIERACDWKWSSAAAFAGGVSPITLDPIPWDWLADA